MVLVGLLRQRWYMLIVAEGPFSEDFDLAFLTLLIWIAALLANIICVGIQFAYRFRFVCLKYANGQIL